jgi:hypothetical protein
MNTLICPARIPSPCGDQKISLTVYCFMVSP